MEERFKIFTTLITSIYRSIRKIKTEEMAEFNLKSPHVSSLYYLYRSKTLTAKELCDISGEDKANMSRSIEYLEKNGYLTCTSAAPKRYKSPLTLTEKGREVGKRIAEKIDRVLAEAGKGLTEEARQEFYRSLSLIEKNLALICGQYG